MSAASTASAAPARCRSTARRPAPASPLPSRSKVRHPYRRRPGARGGRLSPLQEAFRAHHGLQCGFCTPGILMSLDGVVARTAGSERGGDPRDFCPAICAAAPAMGRSCDAALEAARDGAGGTQPMLDLGTSFVASVERDPDGAGHRRRRRPAHLCGMVRQDFVARRRLRRTRSQARRSSLTVLQNRWEAATIHWACQFAGIIITPVNWRAKAEEIDYCIENAEARAIVYQDVSRRRASAARARCRALRIGGRRRRRARFAELASARKAPAATPRADAEAWSLMLYTSGTTARPKGVPRRHRAERAAAVAHVAQNSIATASARSASCRFTTRWACARCWPCRWSAARSSACRGSTARARWR